MTRTEAILKLRRRYAQAEREHKHRLASVIYARLSALVTRQIRVETKQERKAAL